MTTDDGTDGWKGRPDTTASGQNQGYYISRYKDWYIGCNMGIWYSYELLILKNIPVGYDPRSSTPTLSIGPAKIILTSTF
jgi:hypothetical protein